MVGGLSGVNSSRAAGSHPYINFGQFDFPEASNPMRRESALFYPAAHRVVSDAQVLAHLIH